MPPIIIIRSNNHNNNDSNSLQDDFINEKVRVNFILGILCHLTLSIGYFGTTK